MFFNVRPFAPKIAPADGSSPFHTIAHDGKYVAVAGLIPWASRAAPGRLARRPLGAATDGTATPSRLPHVYSKENDGDVYAMAWEAVTRQHHASDWWVQRTVAHLTKAVRDEVAALSQRVEDLEGHLQDETDAGSSVADLLCFAPPSTPATAPRAGTSTAAAAAVASTWLEETTIAMLQREVAMLRATVAAQASDMESRLRAADDTWQRHMERVECSVEDILHKMQRQTLEASNVATVDGTQNEETTVDWIDADDKYLDDEDDGQSIDDLELSDDDDVQSVSDAASSHDDVQSVSDKGDDQQRAMDNAGAQSISDDDEQSSDDDVDDEAWLVL
ncbi:Aste57867_17055 [Aphanomyces stellatus]|uniref:Aste57867_17055 protein n=1 Tax=Aphanomyces stellatus TaxID=120398 RepID=A0A485L7T3_9STRA|nr:hypothetical protein As57867_016997 [Aphanomyces stellatus]VFT93816.1 Aste57867_17055 [Aphanomyces stellatus]